MDYDDNDVQEQNLHLTEEGSSKVSPVLHSYPLPKFDFAENLQEHLGFDSLVENEVFLGITSQEDNQWIEEYSRAPSEIPFNSSVVESRSQNVWSEATSSESVEMLLKSVGQEEKVLEETMVEELEGNLKQSDGSDDVISTDNATFTSQSQEIQVSGKGLDSVVVDDENGLLLGEKKVEDANQDGSNLVKESFGNELGEDSLQKENQQEVLENKSDLSKNFDGNETEQVDKICDDGNEKGSNMESESFVNDLQEDSSKNVNASVEEYQENAQEVLENASDVSKNFDSSEIENVTKKDDANEEGINGADESQNDLSVLKVESGNKESSQNVDVSIDESQKNENASELENIDKIDDASNLGNESFGDEIEDPVKKVESGKEGSLENMDASVDEVLETKNDNADDLSKDFHINEVNEEGSNLKKESFGNELQDLSVSKVVGGNEESSHIMDASIEDFSKNLDETHDDSNFQEGSNLENEPVVDEMQEDPSFSKVESENASDLKNFHSSEPEHIDANEEGSNLANESLVNEVQEDPFVPEVERSSQDVDASIKDKPQEVLETVNENASDKISDENVSVNELEEEPSVIKEEGSDINKDGKTSIETSFSTEILVKDISNKDELAENVTSNIDTSDAVPMDQDFTFNEKGNASLPLDDKDLDMDVDKAPESPNNAEPSLSIQESDMAIPTDTVADVDSSKKPSPDTPDDVTEDQPRSPILGVSLLQDNNKEKLEVGFSSDGSFQKETPQVHSTVTVASTDIVTEDQPRSPILGVSLMGNDKEEKVEVEGSFQKGTQEVDNTVNSVLDTPIPLVKNDAEKDDTGNQMVQNEEGSSSLDKFQVFSFSDTKSFELSQSENVTKGNIDNSPLLSKMSKEKGVLEISSTKEGKSFTFDFTSQTDIIQVSSVTVSSSGTPQLDPNKSHENSLLTPQKPTAVTLTPSESVPKKTTERKPRRKSVAKETPKKVNQSKEKTPRRNSRTEKSPTTGPIENPPNLNNSSFTLQQPFTDNQQVQLRAQILVYGSLISGTSPEEPHMIAAFGQSDIARKAWESAWHACIERVKAQKSQVNTPITPLHSQSSTKDPNQETKIGSSIKNKILSTPTTTLPIMSPMIPISSPLWTMPTPQDRVQTTPIPKNALFNYHQTVSPLHSYQSPRPNPFGQWIAPFSPRFSSLPITESVKLTTVKESGTPIPGVPINVEHIPIPIHSQTAMSPGQPSTESKSRKRKKADVISIPTIQSPIPVAFQTTPSSSHGQPKPVDQTMSKIEESKLQATEAASHADVAVKHCQEVWSQLEKQKNSGLTSEHESKLTSSAVSIAAAVSVAKLAAFAAKIASNVAEQARSMADEVINPSSLTESQKGNTDSSSGSVLSVAREAARRRIEAALTASKHAENLDAIVKAAELAAEAVSQAGKIVSLGQPLTVKELVEKGPDGYWKTPKSVNKQGHSGNLKNVEGGSSGNLEKSVVKGSEGLDLSKTVPEFKSGPSQTSVADVDMPQSNSEMWKDSEFKEGCLVEVYKDDNKKKGAWFGANVLSLKDGKAFVCYTDIQSGSEKLKEWVPLEVEGSEAPKIRIAHPMTNMQGNKKRGRTVFSDYSWGSGDQVDVWVQDSWQEAIVVETNKIDLTSITVQFPGQGKTSVARSWDVRPSLVWKNGKWIEWSSLKGSRTSEGDTPQQKRHKFDKEKDKSSWNIADMETVKHQEHQESRIPTFSTKNISFDIGKSEIDEKKSKSTRSGLQKERSRVVFGVPKPGKKQKFMDVSRHYVAGDSSNQIKNKNNNNNNITTPSNSVRKVFTSEVKEKEVAEEKLKPPTRFRKPPVPTVVRSLPQKEKLPVPGQQVPGQQGGDVAVSTPKKSGSTSKVVVSERLNNKRKVPAKSTKVEVKEVKESQTSESEPRRSNRKIQPTSRLLEGLQSSLTISKMPTVSSSSQRSKVMSKGSPRN